MNELRELYEELILDHNRNPRNYPRRPDGANHTAHGFNPLCGDEFHIHLKITDGVVQDVGFEGAGCAISTASASLMTEAVKGKSVDQAKSLFVNVHKLLTDETAQDTSDPSALVGKLSVLMGVKEFPLRVKCATLAWHTMQAAMDDQRETVTTE